MAKDLEKLRKIFGKTDGYCHLCHKKLSFNNHGKTQTKGAWHIEHSIPKANGGTDHLNNLYPACVDCNVDKGTYHTKTVRGWHGNSRAPYSKVKKEDIRKSNRNSGAVIGGALGTAVAGPIGAFLGAILGGAIGDSTGPRK